MLYISTKIIIVEKRRVFVAIRQILWYTIYSFQTGGFNMRKILYILPILSLLILILVSCSGGAQNANAISTVSYNPETERIEIKATLDKETAKEYRHENIYLMEFLPHEMEADVSTLVPVSQAKADRKMEFSLPYRTDSQTSLYSGFALAVFNRTSGYERITEIKHIENPESLAKSTEKYPEYPSIKGLYIGTLAEVEPLGVRHTVIRVSIDGLISDGKSKNDISYSFNGDNYFFKKDEVTALDYKIKNLTEMGVEVFLEFTLDTPPKELDSTTSKIAASPNLGRRDDSPEGEDKTETHYAMSVDNAAGYRYLASAFEFIAARYTRTDKEFGFCGAFIIGHGVNNHQTLNADTARTLTSSAETYARLLRLAKTALISNYSNGKVFISLDGVWSYSADKSADGESTGALPSAERLNFGAEEYISAVADAIKKDGNFDYGIAVIPHAAYQKNDVWNYNASDYPDGEKHLTIKNLSLITELLSSPELLFSEEERELIIYDYTIPHLESEGADGERRSASSYAYAYYMALDAGVSAFIYNGQWDGMSEGRDGGLISVTSSERAHTRKIYEVFADIDRYEAGVPDTYKSLLSGTDFEETYKENKKETEYRDVVSGKSTASKPKDIDDYTITTLFDFSDGKKGNFYPYSGALFIEIGESDAFAGKSCLFAELYPLHLADKAGVAAKISPESFAGGKKLALSLKSEIPSGNVADIILTLSQKMGEESVFYSSSATIQAGNPQTVYFDISELDMDDENGDVTMAILLVADSLPYPLTDEEGYTSGFSLEISEASVLVSEASYVWLIILISLILLSAIGVFIYFFVLGRNNRSRHGNMRGRGVTQGRGTHGGRPPQSSNRPNVPRANNGPAQRPTGNPPHFTPRG